MASFETFRAVNASGMFFREEADITAAALLFEKVFLPNNFDLLAEAARAYTSFPTFLHEDLSAAVGTPVDLREATIELNLPSFLSEALGKQERTVMTPFVAMLALFRLKYHELFGEVFETDADDQDAPLFTVERSAEPDAAISIKQTITFRAENSFHARVAQGDFPFMTLPATLDKIPPTVAKNLATILAMESVKIALPKMIGTSPSTILEARHRLRDHLPPFWSAMLKLSTMMRQEIAKDASRDVMDHAREIIDTTVRPALIDLSSKLRLERKQWAYRILAPVRSALRLLIGAPLTTQQQLLVTALAVASDTTAAVAENMRAIEMLKHEAGLTFLLKVSEKIRAG